MYILDAYLNLLGGSEISSILNLLVSQLTDSTDLLPTTIHLTLLVLRVHYRYLNSVCQNYILLYINPSIYFKYIDYFEVLFLLLSCLLYLKYKQGIPALSSSSSYYRFILNTSINVSYNLLARSLLLCYYFLSQGYSHFT